MDTPTEIEYYSRYIDASKSRCTPNALYNADASYDMLLGNLYLSLVVL